MSMPTNKFTLTLGTFFYGVTQKLAANHLLENKLLTPDVILLVVHTHANTMRAYDVLHCSRFLPARQAAVTAQLKIRMYSYCLSDRVSGAGLSSAVCFSSSSHTSETPEKKTGKVRLILQFLGHFHTFIAVVSINELFLPSHLCCINEQPALPGLQPVQGPQHIPSCKLSQAREYGGRSH